MIPWRPAKGTPAAPLSRAQRRRKLALAREACRQLGLRLYVDIRSGREVVDADALAEKLGITATELCERINQPLIPARFLTPLQ